MTDQYKCPSYVDDNRVIQNCECGKCSLGEICNACGRRYDSDKVHECATQTIFPEPVKPSVRPKPMSDAEQMAKYIREYMTADMRVVLVEDIHEDTNVSVISRDKFADDLAKVLVRRSQPTHPTNDHFRQDPKMIDKPVDGELQELINTLPIVHQFGCPALEVGDGGLMDYTCQCGNTQKVYTIFDAHLQAAVKEAEEKTSWSQATVEVGKTFSFHGVIDVTNNNDVDIIVAVKRAVPRLTPKEQPNA